MAKTWTVSKNGTTFTTSTGDELTVKFTPNPYFCKGETYKVSVTDENGCSAETEVNIPPRNPEFTVSSIVCEGDALYAIVNMSKIPECDLAYTGNTYHTYRNSNNSFVTSHFDTITPSASFKVNIGAKPSYYVPNEEADYAVSFSTGVSYYSQRKTFITPSCTSEPEEEIYENLPPFVFNLSVSRTSYYFDFVVVESYLVGKNGEGLGVKAITSNGEYVKGYDFPCYIYKNTDQTNGGCSIPFLENSATKNGYDNWQFSRLSENGSTVTASDIYVKLRFLTPTLRMGQNNNCGTSATVNFYDGKFKEISGSNGREFISTMPIDRIGSTYATLS